MRLDIEFARRPRRAHAVQFGVGAALVGCLLLGMVSVTRDTEATPPPAAGALLAEADVEAMNRAIDGLNFPWPAVLAALEKSFDGEARLIRLEAFAAEGRLALQGEARDDGAVLRLPARLQREPVLAEARVLSQSRALPGEGGEYPVRFALEVRIAAEERP